ncbi:MBL fold metallo-hydrolase [Saccharopolyspora sp. WRP15-2]|uniref:MBL fold metallo-hydrolase n=1 Tax=Saccharopolyspora oryzae TaxID=2997343 RepID=A0ABT4UU53_9PSEU|nr:MBL fold metallo-hydrolase [Saccharopolyspora oryzae]MDA3625257.1 MBL fold metallo-hydrolase [Saccharopolyspora oryzae]
MAGVSACSGAQPAATGETAAATGEFGPLELVLLGTEAGPPVEPTAAGISSALVVDGATYVIDCGRSSTTQYARSGLRFDSLRSIFITHLHADHVADYYNYFLLAGAGPNIQFKDVLAGPVDVYGPGPAGGLGPKFGGGEVATVAPEDPTPGIAGLTQKCHEAFAYSTNSFMRDTGIRDVRSLAKVHEIDLPDVGASFENTSPAMDPFPVMEDDRVKVSAVLVPHGPVFPSFAFRFDTAHGSVTFSGDTTCTDNLVKLARGSGILVHEAINLRGKVNLPPVAIDHMLQSHVEVQKVGTIAQRAGVPKLVLSHLIDFVTTPLNREQWHDWASQNYDGEVVIGTELQRIRL